MSETVAVCKRCNDTGVLEVVQLLRPDFDVTKPYEGDPSKPIETTSVIQFCECATGQRRKKETHGE